MYHFAVPDLRVSTGEAGAPAPTTPQQDDIAAKLWESWARTVKGGYNSGCMIISSVRGIVIKKQRHESIIPPGTVTYET